jgi:site-specific DNA-methyltransferase (adenine-specific)
MINKALFSSNKQHWETPQWLFDELHKEFSFTIDLAASSENNKLPRYYAPEQNSLDRSWVGERGFLNPPYGRQIKEWVRKAYDTHLLNRILRTDGFVVALLPGRTDTIWYHDYIYRKARVRLLRGRLKFELGGVPSPHGAPFPSIIAIWQ